MRLFFGTLLMLAASCSGPEPDLRSRDPYRRYLAIRELAPRHDAEALARMTSALGDPHYLVVIGAIEALEENGGDVNGARIAGAARHDHPKVRSAVCDALAGLGDEGTLPLLFRLLGDPEAPVRRASARALTAFGARPDTLRALVGTVADRDASVSFAAHQSLRTLTGREDVPRKREAWERALP